MSRVVKECFGSVISSLAKMRECARCELLEECRAINWTDQADDDPSVAGGDPPRGPGAGDPGSPDRSSPAGS